MQTLLDLLGVANLPGDEKGIIILNLVMAVVNFILHMVKKNNPKL